MSQQAKTILDGSAPCSGCGACTAICPADAIRIQLDKDGFFVASVVEERCIHCARCAAVCQKFGVDTQTPQLTEGELWSAQSSISETVRSCTSGGIAYELSKQAIAKGEMVCGVIYDYDTDRAKTVLVETIEQLEEVKGSKYLQSNTAEAFQNLLSIAQRSPERHFLVVGTPCQIYGLHKVLQQKKMRDRFLLIDLFCHGVPSYLVWDAYLRGIRRRNTKQKLSNLKFRDKKIGWHNFVLRLDFGNEVYQKSSEGDLFYHTFFDNILLGEACFQCPVRCTYSGADIRLGDFWGGRYQEREDGVSAVLLLTEQGRQALKECPNITLLQQCDVTECLKGQSVTSYPHLPLRQKVFDVLREKDDLRKTIRFYRKKFPMKRRLKLVLKESTAKLPDGVRASLRMIYRKRGKHG